MFARIVDKVLPKDEPPALCVDPPKLLPPVGGTLSGRGVLSDVDTGVGMVVGVRVGDGALNEVIRVGL